MFIARRAIDMSMTIKAYRYGLTNKNFIEMGEPYFLGSGPFQGRACLDVFGPGNFWIRHSEDESFKIIGEALDPDDDSELLYVLESRRQGEIWGRWFSKYCPDGELGFANYHVCTKITPRQFENMRHKIEQDILDGLG